MRDDAGRRQHALATQVFRYGGGFVAAVILLVFGMVFFGLPEQSLAAWKLLTIGGQSVGGGGALYLLMKMVQWLISRSKG